VRESSDELPQSTREGWSCELRLAPRELSTCSREISCRASARGALARDRHSLFDAGTVDAEARKRPGEKIIAVGLPIGEPSSISTHAPTFAFEALTRETPWENLKVEIEWCPRRQKCQGCGEEFAVVDFEMVCPKCGDGRSSCISGAELDIAYLELEERCARP
jgi:hydrogenase nickel incorporation protein HypA/HybF